MMLTVILSGLMTAGLSIIGKLATQAFFESILIKVVIFGGDKLAAMTSNDLDNQIMEEVKKRLGEGGGNG